MLRDPDFPPLSEAGGGSVRDGGEGEGVGSWDLGDGDTRDGGRKGEGGWVDEDRVVLVVGSGRVHHGGRGVECRGGGGGRRSWEEARVVQGEALKVHVIVVAERGCRASSGRSWLRREEGRLALSLLALRRRQDRLGLLQAGLAGLGIGGRRGEEVVHGSEGRRGWHEGVEMRNKIPLFLESRVDFE